MSFPGSFIVREERSIWPDWFSPGMRWMALGTICFSTMSAGVKFVGTSLPSQEIVFLRSLITMVLSLGMLFRLGVSPWGNNRKWLLFRGFCGFMGMSLLYYALTTMPIADAIVIGFTRPIWLALLANIVLKEPFHRAEIIGILMSLIGVVVIAQPSFLFSGEGLALPFWSLCASLSGAIFAALAHLSIRRLKDDDHPYVIIFYFTIVAVPGSLLLIGALSWFSVPHPMGSHFVLPESWQVVGHFLVIGLLAQAGQFSMTTALHKERATRASLMTYFGIIYSYLWGIFLFGESYTIWSVIGAGLIVGSVLFASRKK